MNKAIFIVGPTAVGKTALAFEIAKKFSGALISADSVQVYKGLDIISGKDLPEGYSGVPPIHLIDIVDSTVSFTVADFYKHATKTTEDIFRKKKVPIVVGGTGLYVEVLIKGLHRTSEPNHKLRKKLENLSVSELQNLLPNHILDYLNNSERNNPRRLIRKIELSNQQPTTNHQPRTSFVSLVIGLTCKRDILKKRVDERVESRLKEGALKEATRLFKNYEHLSQQVRDANGYKQLFLYLKKEINMEEAIARWKISEYRHAKNQMTWFRKYGNIEWYDVGKKNFKKDIEKRIEKFFKS